MPRTYNPASLYVAPTLVIGLGGTGVEIMRLIKGRMRQSMTPIPGIVEFLAVDTEPFQNLPAQERLFDREFAYIGDYNASSVLEHINNHLHIKDWWFTGRAGGVTGSIHKGARQRRCVGRLSLYVKWGAFVQKLDPKLRKIREIAEKEKVQRRGLDVERNTGLVQVYIVSSVCGGTGSGILLDVAFRIRKELGDDADIVAVCLLPSCFLPEIQSRVQQQRIQANAYAMLREMNYYLSGRVFESCFPDHAYRNAQGEKLTYVLTRPFDAVYLIDRSNGREYLSSLDNIRRMAAQHIFLDIITPIGKKFAARRANLRDLAGEKSDLGSLAIGGFVTASLVLPGIRINDAILNRYIADFIHRRLVGTALAPTEEQAIAKQVADRLEVLDQALRFEQVSEAPADDFDMLFGAGSGVVIDLSAAQVVSEQIAQDIRALFQAVFERHGLRTVRTIIARLLEPIEQRIAVLQSDTRMRRVRQRESQDALNTTPPRARLSDWLLSLPIFSGPTPIQRQLDEWNQRQATLREQVETEEQLIGRNERAIEVYSRLRVALNDCRTELARRIEILEAMSNEQYRLSFDHERMIVFGTNAAAADESAELFELATEVGWEEFEVVGERRGTKRSFVASFLQTITSKERLKEDDEDNLLRTIAADGVFRLAVGTRPNTPMIALDEPPAQLTNWLQQHLQEIYQRHISDMSGHLSGFTVMKYLDWFYRNVRYDGGSSRNSPIDPLLMLRHRSTAPFLEIDEARLGTEHAADTEDVRIIGVGRERASDPLAHELLDEFDTYEDVSTGIPDRLDISFSRHGYQLSALRLLRAYKDAYRYFLHERHEMLHIHRDWPRGMVDLVNPNEDGRADVVAPVEEAPAEDRGTDAPASLEKAPVEQPNASKLPVNAATGPQSANGKEQSGVELQPIVTVTLVQEFYAASDRGQQRERNEDSCLATLLDENAQSSELCWGVYAVADGMGGHAYGEIASQGAIEKLRSALRAEYDAWLAHDAAENGVLQEVLRRAVRQAHEHVVGEARKTASDMGTTLTAVLVAGDQALIANVGDSRTYLWRGGTLRRITRDHSLVMRLLDSKIIAEENIYTHPQRNVIEQNLGQQKELTIDIFIEPLVAGDRLLLCSDGQWEMTRDPRMARIIGAAATPQAACQALIAEANAAGGEDNITAVVVYLSER